MLFVCHHYNFAHDTFDMLYNVVLLISQHTKLILDFFTKYCALVFDLLITFSMLSFVKRHCIVCKKQNVSDDFDLQ